MAYSELIKDFNRIRAYLRSFYVYGFRHRSEYNQKSARGYDNERRRIESWLGKYMSFGQDEGGRRVFLSVDSRAIPENPLYRAFQAKTFTDLDITLHFLLLDILPETDGLSITDISRKLEDRLYEFDSWDLPDESTVRKKLKEYTDLGLIRVIKKGRETRYCRSSDIMDLKTWDAAASFFSEAAPLGVTGSYIQNRLSTKFSFFRFKHHYILNALDGEVICDLLPAIRERRLVTFTLSRRFYTVLPLKIYIGTQSGKQLLMSWVPQWEKISFFRIDRIEHVQTGDICEFPADLAQKMADLSAHAWGISINPYPETGHIEMTVYAASEERFIVWRLEREKRCGTVTQVDETHWRFSADVYDPSEMLPWLRTFIGRITDLQCTDEEVTARFRTDFAAMADLYGVKNEALP